MLFFSLQRLMKIWKPLVCARSRNLVILSFVIARIEYINFLLSKNSFSIPNEYSVFTKISLGTIIVRSWVSFPIGWGVKSIFSFWPCLSNWIWLDRWNNGLPEYLCKFIRCRSGKPFLSSIKYSIKRKNTWKRLGHAKRSKSQSCFICTRTWIVWRIQSSCFNILNM